MNSIMGVRSEPELLFCFKSATCVALACGELRTRQGDIERVSVEYSVQPRGLSPSANAQPSPKKSR